MARGGVDLVMTLVVALLIPEACVPLCSPSCGSIRNIRHPFRLKGDPDNCGVKEFELSCENNRTSLYLSPATYYVLDISYSSYRKGSMRVVDASLDHDDICYLPSYSINLPWSDSYFDESPYIIDNYSDEMVILNCTRPLTNSSRYVDFTPCFNQSLSTATKTYHYASTFILPMSDVPQQCTTQLTIPILPSTTTNITVSPASRIHQQLLAGVQLGWRYHYSPSCPSSCGSIRNIRHPLRLKGDPDNCGVKEYELSCENNRTTLYLHPAKYYVLDISYANYTMRVVDASLDDHDICYLPSYSINLPWSDSYFDESPYIIDNYSDEMVILKCTKPLTNSSRYVDFTPCFNQSLSTAIKTYLYASTFDLQVSDLPQQCTIQLTIPILPYTNTNITNKNISRIHQQLLAGFQLGWFYSDEYSDPW